MTFVVGLTGGIGSGKTTVSDAFSRKDIEIIDADLIAREVVQPGTDALLEIAAKFGNKMHHQDGSLNRAALKEYIFTHPNDKAWLNALLHPIIRQKMVSCILNVTSPYCLLVVPLLVENGLETLCQRVLVVDVSQKIQIQRTIQRDNLNATQVKNIINAQTSRKARLAMADDVLQNDKAEMELTAQIDALHLKYLELADKYRVRNEQ